MKAAYQITDRKDSRALAQFLSGEGQALLGDHAVVVCVTLWSAVLAEVDISPVETNYGPA